MNIHTECKSLSKILQSNFVTQLKIILRWISKLSQSNSMNKPIELQSRIKHSEREKEMQQKAPITKEQCLQVQLVY